MTYVMALNFIASLSPRTHTLSAELGNVQISPGLGDLFHQVLFRSWRAHQELLLLAYYSLGGEAT